MTLSFSQKWPERMGELAGKPNNFEQKVWNSLLDMDYELYSDYLHPDGLPHQSFGILASYMKKEYVAKPHTIRHDPHNRWKPGMKIHPVVNNRTPNRFQFAPVLTCLSVQAIEIQYEIDGYPSVYIDGVPLYYDYGEDDFWGIKEMEVLAQNDGFDSIEDFFKYFNEPFEGKIIHWTNLKY